MPNKKAAIKHLKQTVKRTASNSLVKRNIKEIIKKGKKAVDAGNIDKQANHLIYTLQKAVDKAVKTGVIKKNTGNRKKSRFMVMLKKAGVKIESIKTKKEEK